MNQNELSELTDTELLEKAKKMKKSEIYSALTIGFMIGIVFFSVVKNTWGLVTLIPLFFIYKMLNKPDENKALKEILKERNLG
ncbi:MAG: FUSC family protein [Saprospiraceae bacterium]